MIAAGVGLHHARIHREAFAIHKFSVLDELRPPKDCGFARNAVWCSIIRDALDEFGRERERHKSELVERARGLELSIAKLESAVTALQLALALRVTV
jgi:hypothetical protein